MILILSAGGGNQKGGNSFLDLSPGDGRTHRSARMRASQRTAAPDGAGRSPPPTGGGAGRWRGAPRGQRGVVTPPYGSITGGAQRRADVPKAWLPPTKFRAEIWGVSHGHRPLRGEGEVSATTRASGAQRSVCASGRKGWVGIGAEIIPKGAINVGQSLSRPDGRQLPLHKGAFGDGGCGLPRRFAPRNDSPEPLSFRGGPTGRRGNPSFLRWTGVRAAEVVGPYGRSTEVPATGRCGHRPLRVVAGTAPRLPGQRLAKRKARG